ncbi:histidine phosphatase family protein [Azospirillum sp.]|uniref:histidine phosphatase family protein n=1 Tax=Azospirillum sp. TaxID=34012 RepID=UPI003D76014D
MTTFTPLAGTTARRRVVLMRHGHVSYYDSAGQPLNPKTAPLTDEGRGQVRATAEALKDVPFDRIVCSGLPRTRETAEIVADGRGVSVEDDPGFLEIRAGRYRLIPREERAAAYLYGFDGAHLPGARFAGGDAIAEVQARVVAALERWLAKPGWTHLLLAAHDGVNRLLLSWACGAGLAAVGSFDQDYAAFSVLDVDVEDGRATRRILKAVNVTPGNLSKAGRHETSMEQVFRPLLALD